MKGHEKGVWSLYYMPNGKSLVSGSSDGTAKIWDVASGKCTSTLKKHTGRLYCAISNDAGT
jgi:WD40 repeat protein